MTCPCGRRMLNRLRVRCGLCQEKARRQKHGRHPNSLRNLRRGWHGKTVSAVSKANLTPGNVSKDPVVRQKVARLGGKARAEKSMTQMEAAILRKYGKKGLKCFRDGKRVGYQAAYYRWKTWAMKAWASRQGKEAA